MTYSKEYSWAWRFVEDEMEPEDFTLEVWQKIKAATEKMSPIEAHEIEECLLSWCLYCWDGETHIDTETGEEFYIYFIEKMPQNILWLMVEHFRWMENGMAKPKQFYPHWQFEAFKKHLITNHNSG